uniref:Uncharacterized protein n=1 Tax=Panagrolaimus sp. ES5 TaxID=591445 RepID=A0AC34G9F3_9BILA
MNSINSKSERDKMMLNLCRILQFLNQAKKQLHKIFRERWLIYQKLITQNAIEWDDGSEENTIKLVQLCASA